MGCGHAAPKVAWGEGDAAVWHPGSGQERQGQGTEGPLHSHAWTAVSVPPCLLPRPHLLMGAQCWAPIRQNRSCVGVAWRAGKPAARLQAWNFFLTLLVSGPQLVNHNNRCSIKNDTCGEGMNKPPACRSRPRSHFSAQGLRVSPASRLPPPRGPP